MGAGTAQVISDKIQDHREVLCIHFKVATNSGKIRKDQTTNMWIGRGLILESYPPTWCFGVNKTNAQKDYLQMCFGPGVVAGALCCNHW